MSRRALVPEQPLPTRPKAKSIFNVKPQPEPDHAVRQDANEAPQKADASNETATLTKEAIIALYRANRKQCPICGKKLWRGGYAHVVSKCLPTYNSKNASVAIT